MSKEQSTGGIAFFLTYFSLLIFLSFILRIAPQVILNYSTALWLYLSGIIVGYFFSSFIIGYFSVLLHETKHAIFSSLVGNIPKGMKINRDSGEFSYSYTEDTQALNAMIMLAPYWLPVFSFFSVLLIFITDLPIELRAILIGTTIGMDIILGTRDIHHQQTDLTNITGGLSISISFVIMMNTLNFFICGVIAVEGYLGITKIISMIAGYIINT